MLIGSWGRARAWHVLQDGDDRTERPGPRGTATRRLEPFAEQRGDGMTVTVTRVGGRYRLGPPPRVGGVGGGLVGRGGGLPPGGAAQEGGPPRRPGQGRAGGEPARPRPRA